VRLTFTLNDCRKSLQWRLKFIGCVLLVLLATGTLRADFPAPNNQQGVDLSSPVQNGSPTSYLDLLLELMPDARADATANSTIPLRSISEPSRNEAITGPIKFEVEPHWFNSGGKRLLMLHIDLTAEQANQGTPYEGEAVVLAVFTLESSSRLLDALEIKTDRFTGFWKDRPLFRLDSKNDAFIVSSSHWNAGESYTSLDMLFVDEGRIRSITSQFVFETQGCGTMFSETPAFRAITTQARKYPDVQVLVKVTKEPDESSCPRRTRGYVRQYQGVYRWNPARRRYEGGSKQLDALARFNQMRMSSP
jgi:hypothetical protein